MTSHDDEHAPLLDPVHRDLATDQQTNTINRRKMNGNEENIEAPKEIVLNRRKPQRANAPFFYRLLTDLSHLCTLAISAYIIYLCFLWDFEFFTWHPFLFAIGWMCILTEGVLILSKSNFLADRISHTWRVRCHWILQAAAMCCTVAGFAVVVVNKNLKGKQHWKSWHGLLGLISVISAVIPACVTGLPALYHSDLRARVSPKLNQLTHSIFGMITLVLGGVTMMLSLYTKWFARRTESDWTIFCICWVAMFVPLVWTWFAPIKKAIARTKNLLYAQTD